MLVEIVSKCSMEWRGGADVAESATEWWSKETKCGNVFTEINRLTENKAACRIGGAAMLRLSPAKSPDRFRQLLFIFCRSCSATERGALAALAAVVLHLVLGFSIDDGDGAAAVLTLVL